MKGKNILVIGAGPAGMSAAYELCRNNFSVTVVEKNSKIGGLSRTLEFGEFRTDIGPHRFYSKNRRLYEIIEGLLEDKWIKVDRLTRFYINGRFFLYPIQIKNALLNVGPYKAFRIVSDYAFEKLKNKIVKKEARSFKDYIIPQFGRTLAELNMLNYTEKIWGMPCSQISCDWSTQRIQGLSLTEVIKKMFSKSGGPKTLVEQFYYPETGTSLIYDEMKESIKQKGRFYMESIPVKIVHEKGMIKEVAIKTGKGRATIMKPDYVVSSIPVTEFLALLEPKVPDEIMEHSKRLKYRSHISFFMTISKPSVFHDQWIYLPDREIPFGRIMEPKNFSKKMSPPDKTSLLVEYFCWENDRIWNMSREELYELTIKWLEKLSFVKRAEVIDYFLHKEKYAYPVYDLDYKKHLEPVKQHLNRFKNLLYIGRSGRFKYNNQDHAIEMGLLAARSIIEEKPYNIDDVASGQEYLEKGYADDSKSE